MPSPDERLPLEERLRRLAERGRVRGAEEVFRSASTATPATPRMLLAAAAVLAVVAVATGVAALDRDAATVAAPGRAEVVDDPAVSEEAGGSVPAAAAPGAPDDAGAPPSDSGAVAPLGDGAAVTTQLESHTSCRSVLDRLRVLGSEVVGPYGFDGGEATVVTTSPSSGSTSSGSSAADSGPAPGFSRSNVQETGVDEPDVVKTDGELLVALARGRLQVVSVADRSLLSSLELDVGAGRFFLAGDTVVVVGSATRHAEPEHGPETPVVLVDLSDPRDPRVRSTTWIEGAVRTSRLHDGVVRLVTADAPDFRWSTPNDGSQAARDDARARNRELVERSTLETWLPTYRTVDAGGAVVASGPAASCHSTYTTSEPSGFDTTTVVTLDPATGTLDPGTSVSATPLTVYANDRSLYVVSRRCCPPSPEDLRADIHRFDLTDRTAAPHRSSGSVPGGPVDQFALSERDGHLRIATTYLTGEGPDRDTDSAVWVLAERAADLEVVGSLTGLGREQERIHSVRYHGEHAYVVTFRRTDPLYVVELADPRHPRLLGELHVPGFSSYLQHLGAGRLLGVGRDADEEGRVRGLQLSLFDVSQPTQPRRADVRTYDRGASFAEHDHLALLHWAPEELVVVPLIEQSEHEPCAVFAGAVMLRLGGGALTEVARVSHAAHAGGDDGAAVVPIMRSAVADGRLLTVSDVGVAFGDLADGAEEAFVEFAGSAPDDGPHCAAEPRPQPGPDDGDDGDDGAVPLPLG